MNNGQRITKLAKSLSEYGFDAYIATTPIDMGYLHGLHEGGGERFLALFVRKDGRVRLICPNLTRSQAERCGINEIQSWADGTDPMQLVSALSQDWELRSAMIAVDAEMSSAHLLELQRTLPAALFKSGHMVLSELKRCKEQDELEWMKRAAEIADDASDEVLPSIKAGESERQIAKRLMDAMQRRGGVPTFAIVAAGPNGAEPHHLSDETIVQNGDVVVLDFGCEVGGYHSDITRTICVGTATDEAKRVYGIVFSAFSAAINLSSTNVSGQDVDHAARSVIEDSGFGAYFVHRTGHGIGARVHEEPNIVAGNDRKLEVGNCFSVEPGIYLPGRFGVRIENIVTIQETGVLSLNRIPSASLLEIS